MSDGVWYAVGYEHVTERTGKPILVQYPILIFPVIVRRFVGVAVPVASQNVRVDANLMSAFYPRPDTFNLVLNELTRDAVGHLELLSSRIGDAFYHRINHGLILIK